MWYRSARGGEGAAARHPKFRIPALGLPFDSVPGPGLEVRIFELIAKRLQARSLRKRYNPTKR